MASLHPSPKGDDARALRPSKAHRPLCCARLRSRVELTGEQAGNLSADALTVLTALRSHNGRAEARHLGIELRAVFAELVAAGVARFGTCAARVAVDRAADGTVRVRGRCRMHGGASTGAKTPEGRARIAEASRAYNLKRWATWRAERVGEWQARAAEGQVSK